MVIKEYYDDGSMKTEFTGSQYEYDRFCEKRKDDSTTTIKRPKVVIQENVEKVTKYDVKNVVFSKDDVKEAFKNNPERLQEILKTKLEEGGISKMDYDIPISEIKEIFKKNPEKLQKILEADINNYGRFYTEFTENDIKEIFKDDPKRLQTLVENMNETNRINAEAKHISASKGKTIVKGIAIGTGVGLSCLGIAGGIAILVKNDVIPTSKTNSSTDWVTGK